MRPFTVGQRLFRRDAETNTRDGCVTRTNSNEPNWTILHNKLPPTQLRELDLLGRDRFDRHRQPLQQAHHPALILLFAKKFFRSAL